MTEEHTITSVAFELWMDTATRGLCNHARQQIGEELSDHYASALEEELDAGAEQDVAERNAVLALGDPRRARKRFRRIYLMQHQDNWIYQIFQLKYYEKQAATPPTKMKKCVHLVACFGSPYLMMIMICVGAMLFLKIFGGPDTALERFVEAHENSVFFAAGVFTLYLVHVMSTIIYKLHQGINPIVQPKLPSPPYKAIHRTSLGAIMGSFGIFTMSIIFTVITDNFLFIIFVVAPLYKLAQQFYMSMTICPKLKRYPAQNRTPVIDTLIAFSDMSAEDELKPS